MYNMVRAFYPNCVKVTDLYLKVPICVMITYIHLKCPNKPIADSDMVCKHTLGGIAPETLKAHDWEHPFIDVRYCSDCHAYYRLTIRGYNSLPQFVMIDREQKMPWIEFSEVFPLVKIRGNRITRS